MDHQDWDTYFVTSKSGDGQTNNKQRSHKDVSKSVKIDKLVADEKLTHRKVPKEIAKEIQRKRLEKGIKQKDLANQLNVTVSVINEIETGKAIYNGQLISKIKRKLDIK